MRKRQLGAVIMFLASGSCLSNSATQSQRRPYAETKPYVDKCVAEHDAECVELCAAAFELGNDTRILKCGYKVENGTTVITMSWRDKTKDEIREDSGQGCAGGRRPPGWMPGGSEPTAPAYLAWCATMEAASVTAFARIDRRLAADAAPASLRALVQAAIADELDHARVVAMLARRYGATPVLPEIPAEPAMTDLERAIDNVVEGCVGETVSALHAAFLGIHAVDPIVRAAFTQLAQDEIGHATLAFELSGYYAARLSAAALAQVSAARNHAVAHVIAEPLHPGMLALGIAQPQLRAAIAKLLADPAAQPA